MKKVWDIAAVAGSRVIRQGVLVILMAIAARVLGKELVGIWALIYVAIQFGVLLADSGISTFIIREKNLTPRLYASAFYLSIALAILTTVVIALLAVPLIQWLGHSSFWPEMISGAGAIIPLGISGVLQSNLRREKRFATLFLSDAVGSLSMLVVASVMLLNQFGLWAFIASTIAGAVVTCGVCLFTTKVPIFHFSRDELRTIIQYSAGLLGFASVNFWSRNADSMLVGKYLGASQLGIYSVAYRIMMLPLSQINAIAHTVALPYLSPLQDDLPQLRQSMRKLFIAIGMLTTIPMMWIWLERDLLVRLAFGPGWEKVAELILVLAPLGLLQSLVNPIGLCYQISGQTRLYFSIGLISTAATLLSFGVGVALGSIDAVVIAYAVANVVVLPITIGKGMRTIGGNLLDWLKCVTPFLLVAPLSWISTVVIPMPESTIIHGVATLAILATLYLALVFAFFSKDMQEILDRLQTSGRPVTSPNQ